MCYEPICLTAGGPVWVTQATRTGCYDAGHLALAYGVTGYAKTRVRVKDPPRDGIDGLDTDPVKQH
jgi:hypothetical protein